jgi:hypothetical protein
MFVLCTLKFTVQIKDHHRRYRYRQMLQVRQLTTVYLRYSTLNENGNTTLK